MRWKYDTIKRGGKHYITQIRLVSETAPADFILMLPDPGQIELIDDDGKYQYVIESNPEYDIEIGPRKDNRPYLVVERPEVLSIEEEEIKALLTVDKEYEESIPFRTFVDAMIAMKHGDNSKIDAIEQKLTGETNGN